MIDYKSLLERYADYVLAVEGASFLDLWDSLENMDFSEEEVAELRRIGKSLPLNTSSESTG